MNVESGLSIRLAQAIRAVSKDERLLVAADLIEQHGQEIDGGVERFYDTLFWYLYAKVGQSTPEIKKVLLSDMERVFRIRQCLHCDFTSIASMDAAPDDRLNCPNCDEMLYDVRGVY